MMWKTHLLIPIVLVAAMAVTAINFVVTNPSPLEAFPHFAIGTAKFESSFMDEVREFNVEVPAPSNQDRFSGPLRLTDPRKEDVVASVRFEYGIVDGHRYPKRLHHTAPVLSEFACTGFVREFPIRRDEQGYYYGTVFEGTSTVVHRFRTDKIERLADEALSYFLPLIPDAAHDQRQAMANAGIMKIAENGVITMQF